MINFSKNLGSFKIYVLSEIKREREREREREKEREREREREIWYLGGLALVLAKLVEFA